MLPTVEIAFEGVRHSDLIEGYIRGELESLGDTGAQLTSATIVVTAPRAKHFSGDPYRFRLRLTAEGVPDINVNHDPGAGKTHDAMQIAVRDTFQNRAEALGARTSKAEQCLGSIPAGAIVVP